MPFLANGQNNPALKDYSIKIWSNNEGLPSNNLSDVVIDKRGYLWISTFNGAVRFDGHDFKNFDTKNISQLKTSAVRSILSLSDSSMYFSTESSGLLYYHNGIFTAPFKDTDLPKNILTTYKTPDGKLWIGTVDSGIFYIENGILHTYKIDDFTDVAVTAFSIDADNNLWVASSNIGLIKINDHGYERFTENDGLISNNVYSIKHSEGKLYVGTLHGLSIFENEQWLEDKRFRKLGIYRIICDENKNIWFGTTLGLARLDKYNEFEFLSVKDGLPARTINGIVVDEDRNVWLATYRGGLVQLKVSKFNNITKEDGLSYNSINSITGTKDGRFFVGNNKGKVDVIIGDSIRTLVLNTDLSSSRVKDVLVEDNGTIWLATYMGLLKKSLKEETLYTKSDGLLSDRIRCILKNKDGSIWVGTRNGGISIISKEGAVNSISKKEGLSSDFIFRLDEYANGAIIAGTSGGGLNIIHPNLKIEVINPNNIFSGVSIFNVYVENEKALWLATNVGLFYYDYNNFYLINPDNGLASETVFDVIEDKNNTLWLTSIKGVIKVDKYEVLKLVEGKIEKINSSILDDSEGMNSRECTGATRSFLAEDGRIWIPTINGISILDTQSSLKINYKPPSVYIENVIIDDTPVDEYSDGNLDDNLEIGPEHRSYIFKFTTLSMNAPKKVHFKYKLDGFDKEWVQGGTDRQVKYTNLPYGDYTFNVTAANSSGIWNDKVATLKITIIPYFYETTTFYICLILIFIVFIYLIHIYQTKAVNNRNRELLKLNAELDSFAYSVSHDLKAPLSSIQGLLNVARLEEGNNALEYYARIDSSVEKLDNFIKDIIDYSKNARMDIRKETINVKELLTNVLEGLTFLESEKEIKTIAEIDDDLLILTDKTRFTFIVNNLLTNAYRYADFTKAQPFVKTKAGLKGTNFYLQIEDNGQGIKEKFQSKIYEMFYRANENSSGSGLGLYIVKESLAKLGGNIVLKSVYQKGTIVRVEIPV